MQCFNEELNLNNIEEIISRIKQKCEICNGPDYTGKIICKVNGKIYYCCNRLKKALRELILQQNNRRIRIECECEIKQPEPELKPKNNTYSIDMGMI